MIPDRQLLHQYATKGDEAAFAELVRRQVNLVYSVALRIGNGNTTLAEDVTQAVFTDLARKAGPLSHHPALAGWLHTSARFRALQAIRGEQRRHTREQEATMHDHLTKPAFDWDKLRPVLDEAVGHLQETDRAVVVLRFFQGLSHREVAETLGLNENTVRKRADRALEKLRVHFARLGITVSSTLLASSLSAHSIRSAPPTLAGKITGPALAGSTSVGLFSALLLKILFMSTKTKIALLTVSLALIAFVAINATHLFTQPTPAPAVAAKAAPVTKIAAAPVAVAPPALPPAPPSGPAVTNATLTPSSAANPRTDLNGALSDIVKRLRAGDFESTLKDYLPPNLSKEQLADVRDAVEAFKNTPGSSEEISVVWPKVLGTLVDNMDPGITSHVSTLPRARLSFQLARFTDVPQADKDHPGHIYLLKDKGVWYIEEFNLGDFTMDLRPPEVQAQNPIPN